MVTVLFYLAAVMMVVCAVGVILARSPLRAALFLVVAFAASALLYVLLDAGFVAAMQVLVYAGAIIVLFVFVVMLLNLQPGLDPRSAYASIAKTVGVAAALYIAFSVARGVGLAGSIATGSITHQSSSTAGTVLHMGQLLLSRYLFAFEAVSVVLLVAVVGAVTLGLRRLV